MSPFHSAVRQARAARGWSQERLAGASGISRAAVSAIETSRLVPSTAAALKLAAALDTTVEALFSLDAPAGTPAWAWPPQAGDHRLWRADVGGSPVLFPCEGTAAGTIGHDGEQRGGRVTFLAGAVDQSRTLVVAGCDPTVGLLLQSLAEQSGVRLIPLLRSSSDALGLLQRGLVHAAGLHLGDRGSGSGNDAAVSHGLRGTHRLLHVVRWEEGIAVAPRKRAATARSLLAPGVRWVNREDGSGARQCLDRLLASRSKPPGYHHVVRDHRAVASTIVSGWADAGICVRPAASEAGLDFLTVQREAYELCVPAAFDDDPRIVALRTTLRSRAYRERLAAIPGYATTRTGDERTVVGATR